MSIHNLGISYAVAHCEPADNRNFTLLWMGDEEGVALVVNKHTENQDRRRELCERFVDANESWIGHFETKLHLLLD